METITVRAQVRWFNDAKGYGLVRATDVDLDDIVVRTNVVENRQHLLVRGALIEVTVQESLIGLVAQHVRFLDEAANGAADAATDA